MCFEGCCLGHPKICIIKRGTKTKRTPLSLQDVETSFYVIYTTHFTVQMFLGLHSNRTTALLQNYDTTVAAGQIQNNCEQKLLYYWLTLFVATSKADENYRGFVRASCWRTSDATVFRDITIEKKSWLRCRIRKSGFLKKNVKSPRARTYIFLLFFVEVSQQASSHNTEQHSHRRRGQGNHNGNVGPQTGRCDDHKLQCEREHRINELTFEARHKIFNH